MRISARKKMGIMVLLAATALSPLFGLAQAGAGENIKVTMENFWDIKSFHGRSILHFWTVSVKLYFKGQLARSARSGNPKD